MMMLGREMQLPLHVVVGIPCGEKYPDPETYVDVLQERMTEAHAVARENLRKNAQYQKRAYDHKTRQVVHDTGSYVWYYCPTIKKGVCKKLTSPWKGPYIVVRKLSDVVYQIMKPNARGKPISAHVNKLRPYEGDEGP